MPSPATLILPPWEEPDDPTSFKGAEQRMASSGEGLPSQVTLTAWATQLAGSPPESDSLLLGCTWGLFLTGSSDADATFRDHTENQWVRARTLMLGLCKLLGSWPGSQKEALRVYLTDWMLKAAKRPAHHCWAFQSWVQAGLFLYSSETSLQSCSASSLVLCWLISCRLSEVSLS
jgi:hypothetical protein